MSAKRTQLEAVLDDEGFGHDAALAAALEPLLALCPREAPPLSPELARIFAGADGAPGALGRTAPAGAAAEDAASLRAVPAAMTAWVSDPVTEPLAVVRDAPPTELQTAPITVASVVPLTRAAALKAEAPARPPRTIKRHRGALLGAIVAVGLGLSGASVAAAVGGHPWSWGSGTAVGPVEGGSPQSTVTETPVAHPDSSAGDAHGGKGPADATAVSGSQAQTGEGASQTQQGHDANAPAVDSQSSATGDRSDSSRPRPGGGGGQKNGSSGNGQNGNTQGGNTQGGNSQGSNR
ncbi:hypothetical protein GCM10012320_06930 [Sinomonas cellulolyticus]|uniref:Uncharacterized protein n=1 Tax=Sinomonas cellulolyticus TaxID=2801916 RepID=A0ABS1K2Y2_9MICC|nr:MULTISPECIES: hypothetical protein [Sinomonas]MBL0706020.1 hypothetical protein [Sinomonas cellulolyticus]GHG43086.1 hypothetical protein GCM10012320_06930 [Sinomonas sp. KCTC 49339]